MLPVLGIANLISEQLVAKTLAFPGHEIEKNEKNIPFLTEPRIEVGDAAGVGTKRCLAPSFCAKGCAGGARGCANLSGNDEQQVGKQVENKWMFPKIGVPPNHPL